MSTEKNQKPENNSKSSFFRFILFVLLVAGIIACVIGLKTIEPTKVTPTVQLKNELFVVDVVDTEVERAQGLSGRERLEEQNGMLFVFDEPDVQCFWMKDMNFSIDIIWLNAERQINYIAEDVSPNTYPRSFCPSNKAQYVIELPAGTAQELGLQEGDSATLTF